MSVVTEYLIKIVRKNLDEFGIVIWYDPEKESYQSFIDKFPLDVQLMQIRWQLF